MEREGRSGEPEVKEEGKEEEEKQLVPQIPSRRLEVYSPGRREGPCSEKQEHVFSWNTGDGRPFIR